MLYLILKGGTIMFENEEGDSKDSESKPRIPGEGDVLSGSGLPIGKKFVVDKSEDGVHGVKHITIRQLSMDGSFDMASKEEEFLIVTDECKLLDLEKVKFHNKMKKKFVRKGE